MIGLFQIAPPLLGDRPSLVHFLNQAMLHTFLQSSASCETRVFEKPDRTYVRDLSFLLMEEKVALFPARKTQEDVLHGLREQGYRILEIAAKFEAGNMFRLGNCLFYGAHAIGLMEKDDPKFFCEELSSKLKEQKELSHLSMVSLELCKDFDTSRRKFYAWRAMPHGTQMVVKSIDERNLINALTNYYYHLDCLMSTLPTGDVLLLNSQCFSSHSLKKMESAIYPNRLINLNYEEYLSNPVSLNILCVPAENEHGFVIYCPKLPSTLYDRLRSHGYDLATPETMLVDDTYRKQLALKIKELDGYDLEFNDCGDACFKIELISYSHIQKLHRLHHAEDIPGIASFLENNPFIMSLVARAPDAFNAFIDTTEMSPELYAQNIPFLTDLAGHPLVSHVIIPASEIGQIPLKQGGPHCMTIELKKIRQPEKVKANEFRLLFSLPDYLRRLEPEVKPEVDLLSWPESETLSVFRSVLVEQDSSRTIAKAAELFG